MSMDAFLAAWSKAAYTSAGFFWMAFWAFAFGYLLSSLIQVLVTRRRMRRAMGETGPKSMALGAFFGFLSSSCSFAALATTRALFQKGAGLAPSLAFLLASTNLVIELGIVIAIFLGWQFVAGEYLGGILLILITWALINLTRPRRLVDKAREKAGKGRDEAEGTGGDWRDMIRSREGWRAIGRTYVMEWQMVWKDVLVGFTLAGIISAFVPESFFQALFIGSGGGASNQPGFWALLEHALVGPVAAFFTFIGSMGNIPLAAILYQHGVSFAGIMAFIFSDLVVLPVLRINAAYYGWRMALYILGLFLAALVATALLLHYAFALAGLLPEGAQQGQSITERNHFRINYGFVLNLLFLAASAALLWLSRQGEVGGHGHEHGGASLSDKVLRGLALAAVLWLAGGLLVRTTLDPGA